MSRALQGEVVLLYVGVVDVGEGFVDTRLWRMGVVDAFDGVGATFRGVASEVDGARRGGRENVAEHERL